MTEKVTALPRNVTVKVPDRFLSDPDNLHIHIYCVACEKPLWEQKVLKRAGEKVVSSETKSCHGNPKKFHHKIKDCPLCGKCFYAIGRGRAQHYLILDLNSQIRRLI